MSKTEIFAAYGDEVDDALRNWQQVDLPGYEAFARAAVGRQYLADYRRWSARNTTVVGTPEKSDDRLFAPPPARVKGVAVRSKVVLNGTETALFDLAGAEGAAVIRRIVGRDRRPALTTLGRCKEMEALAELIEAESVRLGRPVSVREALGLAA